MGPRVTTYIISYILVNFLWMEEHLEGDLHTGSDVTFHRVDREVWLETRDIPFKSEKKWYSYWANIEPSVEEWCKTIQKNIDKAKIQIRAFYEGKIVIIFLPINLNMCLGCSKELSHWDGSFEYPQHMFWMRNKGNSFPIHTLIRRPVISKVELCFNSSLNSLLIPSFYCTIPS